MSTKSRIKTGAVGAKSENANSIVIKKSNKRVISKYDRFYFYNEIDTSYKKYRSNLPEELFLIADAEYDRIKSSLSVFLKVYNPLSTSFSVSKEPSLHYFVEFPNKVNLFIEVFLDIDEPIFILTQIWKNGRKLLSINGNNFSKMGLQVNEVLRTNLPRPNFATRRLKD